MAMIFQSWIPVFLDRMSEMVIALQYGHDFSIMDTALNNNYLLNFLESLNLPFIVRMKTPSHLLIERS